MTRTVGGTKKEATTAVTRDGHRMSTHCAREKSPNETFSFLDFNMFRCFIGIEKAKRVVRDRLKLRERDGSEVWRWW